MLKALSIAALIGVASITLAGCGPYALDTAERSTAELGARDYAERAGGSFISCSGQDSDRDGYVTCGVKLQTGPQDLVCSYKANARGCKRK